MTDKPKVFYTATAVATGDGRKGHVRTDDGLLDLDLQIPVPLTKVTKTNPEQLFASGYAACFNSAVQGAAKSLKVKIDDSTVEAKVGIGPVNLHRFALAVSLHVTITGATQEQADLIAERAHEMCPYSNATRGNIEVNISVSGVPTAD